MPERLTAVKNGDALARKTNKASVAGFFFTFPRSFGGKIMLSTRVCVIVWFVAAQADEMPAKLNFGEPPL